MHTMAQFSKLHLAGALVLFLVPMLPGFASLILLLAEGALFPRFHDARVLALWDEAKLLAVLDAHLVLLAAIALAFLCGAYFSGITLKQILFHHGRGVWVGRGKLRYFGMGVRSVSLRHVRDIHLDRESTGAQGDAHPAIALKMRNGKTMRIPTRHFREPAEIVAAALIVHAGLARRRRVARHTSPVIDATARDVTPGSRTELAA
jgi:hypothetical protein